MWDVVVSRNLRAALLAAIAAYVHATGPVWWDRGFNFARSLAAFFALVTMYAIVGPAGFDSLYPVVRMSLWLFSTVACYRLALDGALDLRLLDRTIVALVFVGAGLTIWLMLNFERLTEETGLTRNASAYLLVWCLPFLYLRDWKKLRLPLTALITFAVLLTIKRGAMLALIACVPAFVLSRAIIGGSRAQIRKSVLLMVVFFAVAGATLNLEWEQVVSRTTGGKLTDPVKGGSGRAGLYRQIIWRFWNADPLNQVFGFGSEATMRYTAATRRTRSGSKAHSDWFAMLHSYGLFGIFVFAWMHLEFLNLIRIGFRRRHPFTPSLVMGYTVFFFSSMYSGGVFSMRIFMGMLIAFVAADFRRRGYGIRRRFHGGNCT